MTRDEWGRSFQMQTQPAVGAAGGGKELFKFGLTDLELRTDALHDQLESLQVGYMVPSPTRHPLRYLQCCCRRRHNNNNINKLQHNKRHRHNKHQPPHYSMRIDVVAMKST